MIIRAADEQTLAVCAALRKAVFGDEEHGPQVLYALDDADRLPDTVCLLCYRDGRPAGTVRSVRLSDDTVKLQRFAVLPEYRGKGCGRELLGAVEAEAAADGYARITMDSAEKSAGFYGKYGYRRVSDVFYEDGRPHIKMEKELK